MISSHEQQLQDKSTSSGIGFKSVAKFALLPGFIPLLRRLAARCGEFMHMFTMIFGAVGLIDKNHPCLRPENAGRYRFTDIIGLAAHNVVFDKKHIPQVVMFFAVILSIVLVFAIVLVTFLYSTVLVSDAHAQTVNYFSANDSTNYTRGTDWAFTFLQNVFGETGIGNNIWNLVDEDPNKGASRLQAMFRSMLAHYAQGILVLAVFLLIYIVVTTLVDSAKTGKPFGSKFDNVWAPIRLALAIGLMIPISSGYNAAQLIVFQMSDWGSNLATNVWIAGLDKLATDQKFLEATLPDHGYRFVRGIWLSEVCMARWNLSSQKGGLAKTLDVIGSSAFGPTAMVLSAYENTVGAPPPKDQVLSGEDLIGDNIYFEVRYGTTSDPDFCGRFRVPVGQGDVKIRTVDGHDLLINQFGKDVSNAYKKIYETLVKEIRPVAEKYAEKTLDSCGPMDVPETDGRHKRWIMDIYWANIGFAPGQYDSGESASTLKFIPPKTSPPTFKEPRFFQTSDYQKSIDLTNKGVLQLIKSGQQGGWASAGAFYMMIAYANGAMTNAISAVPTVVDLPTPYGSPTTHPEEPSFFDNMSSFYTAPFSTLMQNTTTKAAEDTHRVLRKAQQWYSEAPDKNPYLKSWLGGDSFKNAISDPQSRYSAQGNADIGTDQKIRPLSYEGLFAIQNTDVNPLGRLVSMGGRFLFMAMTLYAAGIAASIPLLGGSTAAGSIFTSVGSLFGLAGFALTLYLPMLPFIYFTFAVIEWVMAIMEAVIAMPLWALSMITAEGEGIGRTAQSGFSKLIGIVLQPTIIVISLIASLILFAASITFFNGAFALFTTSFTNTAAAGGGSPLNSGLGAFATGMVGAAAFTFMYVFICYSIGQSCFKLIAKIPNEFYSWYGGQRPFSAQMDAGLATMNSYVGMQQFDKLQSSAMGSGQFYGDKLAKKAGLDKGTRTAQQNLKEQEKMRTDALEKGADSEEAHRYTSITGASPNERINAESFQKFSNYKSQTPGMQRVMDALMPKSQGSNSSNVQSNPRSSSRGSDRDDGSDEIQPTENEIREMQDWIANLRSAEIEKGVDSDGFKQMKALYEEQTGGHDYKSDNISTHIKNYSRFSRNTPGAQSALTEHLFKAIEPKRPRNHTPKRDSEPPNGGDIT
jgi:conjugal transfer/type IV secretion protein DotA/TraY